MMKFSLLGLTKNTPSSSLRGDAGDAAIRENGASTPGLPRFARNDDDFLLKLYLYKQSLSSKTSSMLFAGLFVAVIAWFLLYYQSICQQYPFYVAYDMDLTTVLDSLLVSNHVLPAHFDHTTFGMLLLIKACKAIAYQLGIIPVKNFSGLAHSLNPLLLIANLTDFIRHLSPYIVVACGVFLFAAVQFSVKLPRLIALVVLCYCLSIPAFLTQAAINRTELYAVLFWLIALVLATSLSHVKTQCWRYALLFLTGLFLGVCFTSKVQAAIYIMAIPLIILLLDEVQQGNLQQSLRLCKPKLALLLSLVSQVVFIALSIGAVKISTASINGAVLTSAASFSLSLRWCFCLLVLSLLLLASIRYVICKRTDRVYGYLVLLNLLCVGFFLAFLLTPLLYGFNVQLSMQHSIYMAKILFMSQIKPAITAGLGVQSFAQLMQLFKQLIDVTDLYIAITALYVLMVLIHFVNKEKKQSKSLVYCGLLLALAWLMLLKGVRRDFEVYRDMIWLSVYPLYLCLVFAAILYRRATKFRGLCIIVIIVFAILLAQVFRMAHYGPAVNTFEQLAFFHSPLKHNQRQYDRLMDAYYGRMPKAQKQLAMQQAVQHQTIESLLSRLFITPYIRLNDVSLAAPYFRLTLPRERQATILSISPALQGALLIRLHAIPPKRLQLSLQKLYMQYHYKPYLAINRRYDKHWLAHGSKPLCLTTISPQRQRQTYNVYLLSLVRMHYYYRYQAEINQHPVYLLMQPTFR